MSGARTSYIWGGIHPLLICLGCEQTTAIPRRSSHLCCCQREQTPAVLSAAFLCRFLTESALTNHSGRLYKSAAGSGAPLQTARSREEERQKSIPASFLGWEGEARSQKSSEAR